MSRNDIPSPKAPNFEDRLRETVMTYLGKSGDPLDRGITLRDLVDAEIVSVADLRLAKTSGPIPLSPGQAVAVEERDTTPPPTPENFVATGSITHLIVQHAAPAYTQGHGHFQTRLYGATRTAGQPAPTFSSAVELAQFSGTVFAYATNPSTTWHLWIKWETADGVLSANPAGGVNGVVVTTGEDVSLLLSALSGEITEGQLYSALQTRINLIDAPSSVSGSVNARISVVQAQVSELANTPAYSGTATYAADTLVTYEGGIYRAKQTTTGNLPTNTTYWDKIGQYSSLGQAVAAQATQISTLTTDLSAEVSARTTLASQVNNPTTGLAATRSSLVNDYYTKTATDTAISSATSTLVSTTALNSALSSYATNASLTTSYYTKTATDAAISNATSALVSATTLSNTLSSYATSASLQSDYYTKTAADTAISNATSTLVSTTALNNTLGSYTTNAALQTNYYTKTATDTAISNATSTLVSTTTLNNTLGSYALTSALTTEAQTRADADGTLFAQYTVKIDTNGYVSGFGLASTANNSTPTSEFAVRADRFYVASPSGPGIGPITPFAVQTTATTINGVAVSPGVYMDAAVIKNGTLTNAKIANAAIDDAKIASLSASKITAGTMQVGSYIQSSNYSPGTAGWRINSSDGSTEFNNITARGNINATSGTITGVEVVGGTVTGATVRTAAAGQRIQMDSQGLLFLTGATTGKHGSFKYGAKKYGSGVLVFFNNTAKRVPFYVSGEQNVADIHLYNRGSDPTGATYEAGDMICVNGRLKIYVPLLGGWKTVALE